jgi:hypothetical protein
MASSMMSAAIVSIRKDFPGYSSEMYIMSKLILALVHNDDQLIDSHLRLRTRFRRRSPHLGTVFRGLRSAHYVLYHIYSVHRFQRRMLRCQESRGAHRAAIPRWYIRSFLPDFHWVSPYSQPVTLAPTDSKVVSLPICLMLLSEDRQCRSLL